MHLALCMAPFNPQARKVGPSIVSCQRPVNKSAREASLVHTYTRKPLACSKLKRETLPRSKLEKQGTTRPAHAWPPARTLLPPGQDDPLPGKAGAEFLALLVLAIGGGGGLGNLERVHVHESKRAVSRLEVGCV